MTSLASYKKSVPTEIINKGDIIQIDPENGLVKKAALEDITDMNINTRLVVGICTDCDNETPLNLIIDGGPSKVLTRTLLDAGTSEISERIMIYGGNASENTRQIIEVKYKGLCTVNIVGQVDKKDLLCISNIPGKAKSIKYIDMRYREGLRTIGQVKEVDTENMQATIKLYLE